MKTMTFESEGAHVSQDDKKLNATCTLLMLVNAKSTWLACYTHWGPGAVTVQKSSSI